MACCATLSSAAPADPCCISQQCDAALYHSIFAHVLSAGTAVWPQMLLQLCHDTHSTSGHEHLCMRNSTEPHQTPFAGRRWTIHDGSCGCVRGSQGVLAKCGFRTSGSCVEGTHLPDGVGMHSQGVGLVAGDCADMHFLVAKGPTLARCVCVCVCAAHLPS